MSAEARRAVELVAADVRARLREVAEATGNPVNVHHYDTPYRGVLYGYGGAGAVGEVNHDSEPFVAYDGYEYLDHLNELLDRERLPYIASEGNSYVLFVEPIE